MSSESKEEVDASRFEKESVIHHPPSVVRIALSEPIGSPIPAGMFATAGTMLLMALYDLGTGGVTRSNILVGMLVFAGGLGLILVSMWEIVRGNTIAATCLMSFGTFWLSYAAVLIPSFGILDAYTQVPEEIPKALGVYLFVWFVTITLHIPAVIGRSNMFTLLLVFSSMALLFLACGMYTETRSVTIIGDSSLIIVAAIAYYIGLADLLSLDLNSPFKLPVF